MPGETVQEVVRHRAMITACTIGATVLQLLDQTIANVALPFMQGSFSASFDEISWVLTSYITASAIMTAPVGWLAARYGRKSLYVSSILGFTIASMLCGAVAGTDYGVSRIARRIWCRSGAIVAGHPAGHLSA
jgi:DHA2 family multidrug resistance protein